MQTSMNLSSNVPSSELPSKKEINSGVSTGPLFNKFISKVTDIASQRKEPEVYDPSSVLLFVTLEQILTPP